MHPPIFLLGLIADLLRIASYTVKPSNYQWVFFSLILALSICDIIQPPASDDNVRVESGIGCFAAFRIFSAAQFVFILEAQRDLRRKKDVEKDGSISDASLKERLKWGLDLFFSPRGIGWTHEPTSRLRWIPDQMSASKHHFIFHQLRRIAIFTFLEELFKLHSALNPFLHRDGPSIYDASWLWRTTVITSRVAAYVAVSKLQAILSIIHVGLGFSSPRDWPTIHGSWKDAYTVRRFWGRTWHQLFRHVFQTHGKFVSTKLMGLTSKNHVKPYVELFIAFFISGLIHLAGDYRLYGSARESGSMEFFLLQAVLITVEDVIRKNFGFRRPSWKIKLLGYMYVAFWFTLTLPIWMEPIKRRGGVEFRAEEAILLEPYNQLREKINSAISGYVRCASYIGTSKRVSNCTEPVFV